MLIAQTAGLSAFVSNPMEILVITRLLNVALLEPDITIRGTPSVDWYMTDI
jgi:hypothetical protein